MSDIDTFLADYSEPVAAGSQLLRQQIMQSVPDCSETLHTGWKVVSYGTVKKFCAIAPHARWVNLQFHNGAALPDPQSLLQGTGKSMRHVKIVPGENLPEGLTELIVAAAEAVS